MYLISGYLYIGFCILAHSGISSILYNFCSKMDSRNKSDYNNLYITQNTFWANELDNTTDLLELKHTYVILLMHHLFQSFFNLKH